MVHDTFLTRSTTRSRQILWISLWVYYLIDCWHTVLIFILGYSVGYRDSINIFGFCVTIFSGYYFLIYFNYFLTNKDDGEADNAAVLFPIVSYYFCCDYGLLSDKIVLMFILLGRIITISVYLCSQIMVDFIFIFLCVVFTYLFR
jgi:hypothetical protein